MSGVQEKRRILVAMSGGVDSSVAAALLVEAGHDVVGVTMKTFCYEENAGPTRTCCGLDGILDARRVAEDLGIPHYVFDVEEDFTRDVIDDFVAEYAQGRTPNPCVQCNSNTKFRDLLRRGRALECHGIATGHYVRMDRSAPGGPRLLRGLDRGKDQTYFLWGLPPELLPLLHFPVGHLTKQEVRERAEAMGLITARKPESQEICFVPAGDYRDLLSRRLGTRHPALEPGPLVSWTGEVLGEHPGYAHFTVGQRKGLGGGFADAMYVIETRPHSREVVIGPLEALASERIRVRDLNWLGPPPSPGDELAIQIRHRAPAARARVESLGEDELLARFQQPQRAVTPGQSAAVFLGEALLGGGRIQRLDVR